MILAAAVVVVGVLRQWMCRDFRGKNLGLGKSIGVADEMSLDHGSL